MSIEITMPRLSDTMEQGTIIRWMVKEGDAVSAGDAIADIETDKATMEMQVYDDGTIAKIIIGEGQTVEVGTLIAVVAEEDESLSDIAASVSSAAQIAANIQNPITTPAPPRRQRRGKGTKCNFGDFYTAYFLFSFFSSMRDRQPDR